MKFLLDDGNQHVSRHGAPDLRLDGVLAVAQELLDAQVEHSRPLSSPLS